MEERTAEFEELLSFFKALGNEKRLKIVGLLAQKSLCVEELAAILDLSAATVSHHLRKLVEAGLVSLEEALTRAHKPQQLKSKVLHTTRR